MTRIEQVAMLALMRLKGGGTAAMVWQRVERMTRKTPSFAALYRALDRLCCHGLIDDRWVGADPRARRHFSTNDTGLRALGDVRAEARRRRAFGRGGRRGTDGKGTA